MVIKNQKALGRWMCACVSAGHDVSAITGPPPAGATYEDGTPIMTPINVAWENQTTGEKYHIEYDTHSRGDSI